MLALLIAGAFAAAAPAAASEWLPHPADATWTYQFTDSVYNATPSIEHVSVVKTTATSYTLGWTVDGATNKTNCPDGADLTGWVEFQDTNLGILNGANGWCGAPPPPEFPILCSTASQCGNSMSSTLYLLIWGSRAPILGEPLLEGSSWSTAGGAQNDVSGLSTYDGTESITVPAFPQPVVATKVRTQITQAGALGDPYGSGVRTVWWVHGVGPVKILFQHAGGANAPISTAVLQQTNQTATSPPPSVAYFPMKAGLKGTYRWTNAVHFKAASTCHKLTCSLGTKVTPEVESFEVSQASNGTAIAKFQSLSGPLKVAGAYQFTTRLDGVTSVSSATKAASLVKLPPLGPASAAPDARRHFFTPFDLMTFGFGPLLPAYPTVGTTWQSDPKSGDFNVYAVNGSSRIVGRQKVTVPAGTFDALVVSSTLKQPGFPFGSGTRTMWFAAGRGLVKLQFKHGDGSISLVELIH